MAMWRGTNELNYIKLDGAECFITDFLYAVSATRRAQAPFCSFLHFYNFYFLDNREPDPGNLSSNFDL